MAKAATNQAYRTQNILFECIVVKFHESVYLAWISLYSWTQYNSVNYSQPAEYVAGQELTYYILWVCHLAFSSSFLFFSLSIAQLIIQSSSWATSYAQNNTAVVLTEKWQEQQAELAMILQSCWHDTILRQRKVKSSDWALRMCSLHANACWVLSLWWLHSRCLWNLFQSCHPVAHH